MGDYYGYGNGGSGGGSSGGAPTPNFSVPPPNFSKGPNYQNQNSQQNSYGPPPPQGNWGPNQSRNDDSSGYGSGNYNNQGRNNQGNRGGGGGGAGNFGNSQRNESGYNDRKNNFSGGSVNKSGYNKAGGYDSSNDNMIIQEDTIFVSGMSSQTTEEDIACHFGAIGIIKKDKKTMKPKIWLYRNKETGESKGEATITYDDSNAAKSAISWFDNKDFNGANIHVSLAQRQNNWQKGGNFRSNPRGGGGAGGPPGGNRDGGSGGNRGGFNRDHSASGARNDDRRSQGISGGGGGGFGRNQRDGDWTCSSCNNTNFAWRNECNRCKEPKSGAGGGMTGGGSGNSSFRQGGAGGPPRGGNSNFNRRDQGPMRGAGDRGNDRNRPY
ncbi:RNA-binding protein cabeza isoform X3 [Contarinia nasturtii]|uniref:RNA-binding protein cabeza isoform X3 n=1 Tax=Contarinia nasturtii TaxID=265458 RepID=UPI0012D46218|nr:RNA-binding protein cabeza isoform X3 [Contarinia nasturtii]